MVEFSVSAKNYTRKPHFMTFREQERIEFVAQSYLRHVIVIMTEMALRPYRELLPMLKSKVDLENRLVHISDPKTDNGIGDMPMMEPAYTAFKEQMDQTPGSDYLFLRFTERGSKPYLCSLKKVWRTTLRRAGVPYFSLCELRHTFATRPSSGGVAGHFVTLMLRQGDAGVFKRHSQAKLNHITQNVTVSAAQPPLQTQNAAIGQVIGSTEVVNLTLNGRNFLQLATLTPGATPAHVWVSFSNSI
ncbi:MAG: tyrosine-type recombinase/integrase [Terriglobia bacterium]